MNRWLFLFGAGFLAAACDRSPAPTSPPGPTASTAPAPTPSPSAAPLPSSPAAPRVVVRNAAKAGAVEIVAQAPVQLDANLIVERQTREGSWEPLVNLDLDSMKLVESCGQKIGPCVSLEAGRTLRPVPWSGMSCSSQCNPSCDKNVYRGGRPLRFVVKACDGAERFEGAPFELPPYSAR